MKPNEITRNQINQLKQETESILFAPHSINEKDQDYWMANFKGWVLDNHIDNISRTIIELNLNDYLIKRIQGWIEEVEAFLEDDLKRRAKKINYKHQISYIKYFISKLTALKNDLISRLSEQETNRDLQGVHTDLTKIETVLLMLYLQEAKAVMPYGTLKNEDFSEAFHKLSGYSKDQLKKAIAGNVRSDKNELSTNIKNYSKLKEIFQSIISAIDSDIASFH